MSEDAGGLYLLLELADGASIAACLFEAGLSRSAHLRGWAADASEAAAPALGAEAVRALSLLLELCPPTVSGGGGALASTFSTGAGGLGLAAPLGSAPFGITGPETKAPGWTIGLSLTPARLRSSSESDWAL